MLSLKTLFALLAVASHVPPTVAVPAPQPGSVVAERQTSRQAVIDRLHNRDLAPQRRASPVPGPVCPTLALSARAVVYLDRYVPNSALQFGPASSLEECIQRCIGVTGCVSGDFSVSDGQGTCWLTGNAHPRFEAEVGYSAFVLNSDCARYQPSAPSGATCCGY